MTESISAAEQLVDTSSAALTSEEWDVIIDWARGVLPSLRCAFK